MMEPTANDALGTGPVDQSVTRSNDRVTSEAPTTSQKKLERIEMKFRLGPELSEPVRQWARDHLGVDENCNANSGDTYDINTLYLDTPDLDLFHRTGRIGSAKHRVRRYGDEQTLWLETKRKKKMVVRKNRTAVFESDYLPRAAGSSTDAWCGNWFLERIAQRGLQPAIQIAYRRFARVATLKGESMRLTIDHDMRASTIRDWQVNHAATNHMSEMPFGDCEILELKFHGSMPWLFKQLLKTFAIPATGFSKYRTAVAAQRLAEPCYA